VFQILILFRMKFKGKISAQPLTKWGTIDLTLNFELWTSYLCISRSRRRRRKRKKRVIFIFGSKLINFSSFFLRKREREMGEGFFKTFESIIAKVFEGSLDQMLKVFALCKIRLRWDVDAWHGFLLMAIFCLLATILSITNNN
jgi:hypothetical protein